MKELLHNYISNPIKNTLNSQHFNHLESVGQSYTEHFSDSMNYSWTSLKSSFYFFAHGFYPDVFETRGSSTIMELSSVIKDKLDKINERQDL
jgi:hypothetical protein